MVEVVGLEPTSSEETGVTIRRANQLLNTSMVYYYLRQGLDSNQQKTVLQTAAFTFQPPCH